MGFDSKCDFIPPTVLLEPLPLPESFALGLGASFFGGIQYSPINSCLAVSCNFGVPAGEEGNIETR